jgi:organic hydroperoxide reductase OsmC/OhrA
MAHEYLATVTWERGEQPFLDNKYARAHLWSFDGGISVPGSSAPSPIVPVPLSRADAVDPEEALVAAVSSCHMLFFLAFCAIKGFRVDRYVDAAVGTMTKNERGKLFVSHVALKPVVTWSGDKQPTDEEIARLHHRAHEECYIANSLRADVEIVVTDPIFA